MAQERRSAPRIPFSLDVEVWGRRGPSTITDLSTGGVFIKTEEVSQYVTGDEINLITTFPINDEAMMLKGQVARVSDNGIGVKFTGLNPNQADVIEDCISSYRD